MRLFLAILFLLALIGPAPAGDCGYRATSYRYSCVDLYDGDYHWQAAGWSHGAWFPAGYYRWTCDGWYLRGYGLCRGYAHPY